MIVFSSLNYDAIFNFIYCITIFIVRNNLINELDRISRSIFFILCLYWIHLIYNVIIFSSLHYDAVFYLIYYITIFIVRNDLTNELDRINRSIFFVLRLKWIRFFYNVIIFLSLNYDAVFYIIYYTAIFIVRNDLINELDRISRSIFLYYVCIRYI